MAAVGYSEQGKGELQTPVLPPAGGGEGQRGQAGRQHGAGPVYVGAAGALHPPQRAGAAGDGGRDTDLRLSHGLARPHPVAGLHDLHHLPRTGPVVPGPSGMQIPGQASGVGRSARADQVAAIEGRGNERRWSSAT